MRFSLRTLLIFMLIMGPLCALGWTNYQSWLEERHRRTIQAQGSVSRIGVLPTAVFIRGPGRQSIQALSDEEVQVLNVKMQEAQRKAIFDLSWEREQVVIPGESKDRLAKLFYSGSGPVRKEREK